MKTVILGATGTLGRETIKQLLAQYDQNHEIVCVSRDELKQKELMREYKHEKRLSFSLGDIRDIDFLNRVLFCATTVFHFAALKHVDLMELNPEESIKTNLLGSINVAEAAQNNNVKHVVFSSTDKAVDPINAYGMCKGLAEKVFLNRNQKHGTKFSVFRWGNVVGSRGSIIPEFARMIRDGRTVGITNEFMTRFFIRIEDAVSFMLGNYKNAPHDKPMIPKMKATDIVSVIHAIKEILGYDKVEMKHIGLRPGEKIHESLWSVHDENHINSLTHHNFTQEELIELIKPVVLESVKEEKAA